MFRLDTILSEPRRNTWIQSPSGWEETHKMELELARRLSKHGRLLVCLSKHMMHTPFNLQTGKFPKSVQTLDVGALTDNHSLLRAMEQLQSADFVVFLGAIWTPSFLQMLNQASKLPTCYGIAHYPIQWHWRGLDNSPSDAETTMPLIKWERTLLMQPHTLVDEISIAERLAQVYGFNHLQVKSGDYMLLVSPSDIYSVPETGEPVKICPK